MAISTFWRYSNYNAPVNYLFDKQIVEMDISKANINILMDRKAISYDDYADLVNADRMVRQYMIGCLIRDKPEIQEILNQGLMDAREALFNILNLENSNVLHIAKDAVFIVVPLAQNIPNEIPISGFVKFTKRSSYTSYLRLNRLIHFYYTYNMITGTDSWKIRGMSQVSQEQHYNGFCIPITSILRKRQVAGTKAAYDECKWWYEMIATDGKSKFPDGSGICKVELKRRFDSQSLFDLKINSGFAPFQAEYLSDTMKEYVDPSYNLSLLKDIGNYLLCEAMSGL